MIKPIPYRLLYAGYVYLVSGIICLMPKIVDASADEDRTLMMFTGELLFCAMIFWFHLRVFHGLITLHKKFRDIALFLLNLSLYFNSGFLLFSLYLTSKVSRQALIIPISMIIMTILSDLVILHVLNRSDIQKLFESSTAEMAQES